MNNAILLRVKVQLEICHWDWEVGRFNLGLGSGYVSLMLWVVPPQGNCL